MHSVACLGMVKLIVYNRIVYCLFVFNNQN
jgi:hypothetical protein